MWKSGFVALLAASVFTPVLASPATFERGMNTMWEVLWHQSGTPTRLVRWEGDLKVRMHGVDVQAHRQHTLRALRDVAAETGRQVVDVTDAPDAAQQANVHIEITPDSALSEQQPCETRLDYRTEARLESVTMKMRSRDARRCAYHEAMHVMGVRGHPGGDTVLSYFHPHTEGLQPLDRAMLRAWYSPRAYGGMTPFEILPLLADELVAVMPDRAAAGRARDAFLARTVQQMQAFANGSGDVPAIVRQSGKSSDEGIRMGRMEVSYFLGIAYQQGVTVARDDTQATRWLQRAATMGSRTAQARLGAAAATTASGSR